MVERLLSMYKVPSLAPPKKPFLVNSAKTTTTTNMHSDLFSIPVKPENRAVGKGRKVKAGREGLIKVPCVGAGG